MLIKSCAISSESNLGSKLKLYFIDIKVNPFIKGFKPNWYQKSKGIEYKFEDNYYDSFENIVPTEVLSGVVWMLEHPQEIKRFVDAYFSRVVEKMTLKNKGFKTLEDLSHGVGELWPKFFSSNSDRRIGEIKKYVILQALNNIFRPRKVLFAYKRKKKNFVDAFFQNLEKSILVYMAHIVNMHSDLKLNPNFKGIQRVLNINIYNPSANRGDFYLKPLVNLEKLANSEELWVAQKQALFNYQLVAFDKGVLAKFFIPTHVKNSDFIFYNKDDDVVLLAEEKHFFSDKLIEKGIVQLKDTALQLSEVGFNDDFSYSMFFKKNSAAMKYRESEGYLVLSRSLEPVLINGQKIKVEFKSKN